LDGWNVDVPDVFLWNLDDPQGAIAYVLIGSSHV
jgi:hypothetical protein